MIVAAPDLAWHAKFDPEGTHPVLVGELPAESSGYLAVDRRYYDLTLYRVVDAGP